MTLLPLAKFVEQHQPRKWKKDAEYTLYHSETERFRIIVEHGQFDTISESFVGPWRDEELAKQGVSATCSDAIEFGERLVETMCYHLSPHQVQHIVNALQRDLARWEAERMEAIKARPELFGTTLPTPLSERCKD